MLNVVKHLGCVHVDVHEILHYVQDDKMKANFHYDTSSLLFQIHAIELLDFVERNLFEVVIQVGVVCFGDNQQFFVFHRHTPISAC